MCATCGTAVCSYPYRFHPPESAMFERCIGLAWCSPCRIYGANVVHVPRQRLLVDDFSALPSEQRDRVLRSETRVIEYLDRLAREAEVRAAGRP
ncbi:hypothetical protein ACIA8F_36430 [Streptomyces sp. NPDC051563]|uniref:hypothetical protein n=1 Tax=Streptomyces sp. NPDC051563 TaxID=3365659 RepID=UPI0037AC9AD2